jgi:hypothetical protein
MSMEHHRCFRVCITKTRAIKISDMVFFKHQYITNQMVSPKFQVVAAAQQLMIALQGNIPAGNESAEAFAKSQQAIHQNNNGKQRGSKGQGQSQQSLHSPGGMTNNTPTKGGSTHSKGGSTKSKGDRKPGCSPHQHNPYEC